jgi:hypothetical protein
MRRLELQEIHDHPSFPGFLRDLVTDGLQSLWNFGNTYQPVLSRLLKGIDRAGEREVLDLCSGGGGPWLRLARELQRQQPSRITVRLTDKYPNLRAFQRAKEASPILRFEAGSVDAASIPPNLRGFRTIFSSFHHFQPDCARSMLSDAAAHARGVGVFEVARRSPRTMLAICFIPLLTMVLTPSIRPFRGTRLLWTYLVPVVPFVLLYDGLVSCLRAYSVAEMEELIRPLASANYRWEIGVERKGFLPVTYLIGAPAAPSP